MKRVMQLHRTPRKSDGNVPCRTCRACCYLKNITLHPELGDDVQALQAEEYDGKYFMPRKGDHCLYLDRVLGCTIYESRPSTCRQFDCRAAYTTFTPTQRQMMVSMDQQYQKVMDKARQLQLNPKTRLRKQ